MDFIGCKNKLNAWIFDKINEHFLDRPVTFLDACAGSGSTSRYAASQGYDVISCDLFKFSSSVVNGSIGITAEIIKNARLHLQNMNALKGVDGFFFQNYSESAGRLYFSDANARKIDACREYLETVEDLKTKDLLLYSMVEGLSRVSNTTGVQAAFLKKLKARALANFVVRLEQTLPGKVSAVCGDVLELLKQCPQHSVLYINPPYTGRQYGPNYDLYETLVLNDNPTLRGKTGLRDWQSAKSDFCAKDKFLALLSQIVELSDAPWVYLSYSSDGLVSAEDITSILFKFGTEVGLHMKIQRRYKADKHRHNKTSFLAEYLFELKRSK